MLYYILGNLHQYAGGGAISSGREVRSSTRSHSDMEYKEIMHKEGLGIISRSFMPCCISDENRKAFLRSLFTLVHHTKLLHNFVHLTTAARADYYGGSVYCATGMGNHSLPLR